MPKIETKKYRDAVFRMLFDSKKELLSLYNALNNTSYTDEDDVTINTIEDSTFMRVKNDVSFIFNYELNIFEHQATPCPNMPLRDLFHVAKLLKKITSEADLYSNKPVLIPVPRFFIFYNGTVPMEDQKVYKLSDQFEKSVSSPELELIVTALNINYGHNKELMDACNTLKDYSLFVSIVRQYIKEIPKDVDDKKEAVRQAISSAIDKCIANGILSLFLTNHRAKVQEATMWDYNEELHLKNVKQEGYDEGYDTGYDNGALDEKRKLYDTLVSKGYNKEDAMELTGLTSEQLLESPISH